MEVLEAHASMGSNKFLQRPVSQAAQMPAKPATAVRAIHVEAKAVDQKLTPADWILTRIDVMCTWLQLRIALRRQDTQSFKMRCSIKRGTTIVKSRKQCVRTVIRKDMTIAGVGSD